VKTKDFRTLKANRVAHHLVGTMKAPKDQKEYVKAIRVVAIAVSEQLGNTPAVAAKSYINPEVFAKWRGGLT